MFYQLGVIGAIKVLSASNAILVVNSSAQQNIIFEGI